MTKPLWATKVRTGWAETVTLIPPDLSVVPQHAVLLAGGDWVMSQGQDSGSGVNATDNLILTRYTHSGKYVGRMRVQRGGHGDRLTAEATGIGVYINTTWCVLPWITGKDWTVKDALTFRALRRRLTLPAGSWCQGEILDLDGESVRLYGVPYKKNGPSLNPDGSKKPEVPARLDYIVEGKTVRHESLAHLGRDSNGDPIGGRLEPEGLAVGTLDGDRVLIVGFAVNGLGKNHLVVYTRPV